MLKLLKYIIIWLWYWFLRLNDTHSSVLNELWWNKTLKGRSLWHLRGLLKCERSELTWQWHLGLLRRRRFNRHLFSNGILPLIFSLLHLLLKFVLSSVLFELFLIKSFGQVYRFFFDEFLCLNRSFNFNFFIFGRFFFDSFRFCVFNLPRLFFFKRRFLFLFFNVRLAHNWLRLNSFGRLSAKESTPFVCWWLLRLLLRLLRE